MNEYRGDQGDHHSSKHFWLAFLKIHFNLPPGSVFNAAWNLSSSAAASVAAATPFNPAAASSRFSGNASNVSSNPMEMKDQIWGIPISLKVRCDISPRFLSLFTTLDIAIHHFSSSFLLHHHHFPFQGRLGQVCVIGDVLQPGQIKTLFSFSSPSADVFNVFDTQPDLETVKDKRLFHFHPKCVKDNVCHDLANAGVVGRLTGD